MGIDPYAIGQKLAAPERHVQVLVVGAGPAGTAAAIEAANLGAQVLLVDENPVPPGLMGLDTPLYYGGRMTGAVQNTGRLTEQIFTANPDLATAMEAGVEVMLGVCAWGAFVNGPGVGALPAPMVGLADQDRAWLVGYDRLILATGARDIAMAFPGWDQPGVMGANGLAALVQRYDAFAGRRLVILGAGDLGLHTALMALDHGMEVAAILEAGPVIPGQSALRETVMDRGVPIHTGQVIHRAHGGLDGVERVDVGPVGGPTRQIVCDTVCLAIGLAPAIELFEPMGGRLIMDPTRGGHVPALSADGASSLVDVTLVGDCAGLTGPASDHIGYQQTWMRALLAVGDDDVIVCQCEAVSRGDLTGVQPPRYLERPARLAARDLLSLAADGPINQDQIKRLTRAGMGACQGRRCREQVALTLACATNTAPAAIPLAGFRAPVRPLALKILADWNEDPAVQAGWDVWFGNAPQWVPYRDIDTAREAHHLAILSGQERYKAP